MCSSFMNRQGGELTRRKRCEKVVVAGNCAQGGTWTTGSGHWKAGESGGWLQEGEAAQASRWSLSRIESGRDQACQGLTLSWVYGENGTQASYHERRRNGGRTSSGDCHHPRSIIKKQNKSIQTLPGDDLNLLDDGGEIPKSQGRGWRFDSWLWNLLSTW